MGFGVIDLYEQPIRDAMETAKDLIEEAREVLQSFGAEEDLESLQGYDVDYAARDRLEEIINVRDLTNSIIGAYLGAATGVLTDITFFVDRGIYFDYHTNCDDSAIEVHVRKGDNDTCEAYSDGALTDMVRELIINEVADDICSLVEEYLSGTGREYPREWVLDDLREVWNLDDIESYIKDGGLTEAFKEIIDSEAREIEPERE